MKWNTYGHIKKPFQIIPLWEKKELEDNIHGSVLSLGFFV